MPTTGDEPGTNGALGGARAKGKKAGAGKDQLVEMRFYIPGVISTTKTTDSASDQEEEEEAGSDGEGGKDKKRKKVTEEQNAANLFYDTLMEKADIGEVAGDTFATFLDVLHLTPRYVCCTSGTTLLIISAEVVSISICTRRPSVYVVRHTITKSSTKTSKSSCSSPSLTSYTQ